MCATAYADQIQTVRFQTRPHIGSLRQLPQLSKL